MTEQWRLVPGWPEYEVSDLGSVRSLRSGRTMRVHALPHTGHMNVKLKRSGAVMSNGVHVLVAAAFIGPRPEGMEVCHNNGDPNDNRLANLRYGTPSANHLDRVLHGTHNMSRKTHCKSGHAFDDANTIHRSGGGRDCATCRRERSRASRERRRLAASASVAA